MSRTTNYVWFDAAGKIVRVVYCKPAERAGNARPGCDWIEAASAPDPDIQWVDAGEIAARPAQAPTLTGLVLASLPDPCEVIIEGTRYEVTGGTATLSFSLPGTYAVRVEAFPYLPADFEAIAP